MFKRFLLASLCLAAGTALAADDFDARVARATKLERSQAGQAYLPSFMTETNDAFEKVIGACFRGGKVGTREEFTVVMDIMGDGTLANVAVDVQNERTACYAERVVVDVKAPPPPAKFAEKGFPIVIHTAQNYL